MGLQIGGAILDFVVLAVLRRKDAYGYQLTQEVRGMLDVSETSLYPALKRLQKGGLLTTYDQPWQGRNRRYYHLTEQGRAVLAQYQREWHVFEHQLDDLLEEQP